MCTHSVDASTMQMSHQAGLHRQEQSRKEENQAPITLECQTSRSGQVQIPQQVRSTY